MVLRTCLFSIDVTWLVDRTGDESIRSRGGIVRYIISYDESYCGQYFSLLQVKFPKFQCIIKKKKEKNSC